MILIFNRCIEEAHYFAKIALKQGGNAIDATLGNGNDALFLSKYAKLVYAFDIQKKAVETSRKLLSEHCVENVKIILDSHEAMLNYIKAPVHVIMFNLGYLPNSDKSIKTQASSTINALSSALKIIETEGLIIVTLYRGHPEGEKEALEVENFLLGINPKTFTVKKYQVLNRYQAPYNIVIHRHK